MGWHQIAAIAYEPIVDLELGPLTLSIHSIGIVVGFLAGARLMLPAVQRRGITADQLYAMLIAGGLGAIVGARVAYVVNHLGEFSGPADWFDLGEGGISLLGGIAGGILAAVPVMRSHRLPFWVVVDAAAPGLALGIIFGRIGDLIVADHLGKPTDLPFGYECPAARTASACAAPFGSAVHQPALYDLVAAAALLVLLLRLRRRPRPDGFLFAVFVVVYGFARFVEDFFRIDETHGTGLTGSQWASLAAVIGAIVVLRRLRDRPPAGAEDAQSPEVAMSADGSRSTADPARR